LLPRNAEHRNEALGWRGDGGAPPAQILLSLGDAFT
jgi:hypothetical protein